MDRVAADAEDKGLGGIEDAHVVGDAAVLAGFVSTFYFAVQPEGELAVQPLVPKDAQHSGAGGGAYHLSPVEGGQEAANLGGADGILYPPGAGLAIKEEAAEAGGGHAHFPDGAVDVIHTQAADEEVGGGVVA